MCLLKQIKSPLRFLFVLLFSSTLMAQNLVPNPSFEFHTVCPSGVKGGYVAVPWDTVPHQWSYSDYFHPCCFAWQYRVPKNGFGFQYPVSGNAYVGITCYVNYNPYVRSYIYTKLLCPLQAGKTYKAGFFVNTANRNGYAIDQMGMYIGDTIYGDGTSHALDAFTPQIRNTTGIILQDTLNWIEITGTFTAQGNEKYIAIGNFAVDSNTTVKDSVGLIGNNGAYYYIDSVYVIPLSTQISISSNTSICTGSSVTLQAGGSNVYYWFNSVRPLDTLGRDSMLVVKPDTAVTTYTLRTCLVQQTETVSVTQTALPIVQALASPGTIIIGASTQLSASGGVTYVWYPSAGLSDAAISNPTATPDQSTAYCVTVTDANGCVDSACITIIVEPPCGILFIPNAFSPNGDEENDTLRVYMENLHCIKEFHLVIFNRWGETVFESSNPKTGWDGTYNGERLDVAVFNYYLDAMLSTGEKINRKGNVSLMR